MTKKIEHEVTIDAPVDAVWSAVASREMANWFPLAAEVNREEGTVFISWGPDCEGKQKIQAWDEGKLLRVGDDSGVVEYWLESDGGKTKFRLVQSQFGSTDWADESFETTSAGWKFEMAGLKHYLERHRGVRRHCAWARSKTALPMAEVWARVFPLFGSPAYGERYDVVTALGDRLHGQVLNLQPPRTFTGFVENWNDGMLRVELTGRDNCEAWVWLSTWGVPEAEVKAFEVRWNQKLREIQG